MRKCLFSSALVLGLVAFSAPSFALDKTPGGIPTVTPRSELTGKPGIPVPGRDPHQGNLILSACPDVNEGLLSSAGGTISGDTTGAANDITSATGCTSDDMAGPDNIHEFTVDTLGTWTFDTCGTPGNSPFDTSLAIFDGSGGCPGSSLACNGDNCAGFQSTVSALLCPGTTYYLVVDGWGGEFGPYVVDYSLDGSPATCTDGVTALGTIASGVSIPGDTTGATNDVTSAAGCTGSDMEGPDDLYSFSPDASGIWECNTCGPGSATFDTSLAFRQDDGFCNSDNCPWSDLACNGDACASFASTVSAFLTAGTTYYLVVDGWGGEFGAYDVVCTNVQPACLTPADCDDGSFCNGVEVCDVATGECLPGTNPCSPEQDCDDVAGSCTDPDECISWWAGREGSPSFCPGVCAGIGLRVADDAELEDGLGHELISYTLPLIARAIGDGVLVGDPYTVVTELWSAGPDCNPLAPIAGTQCTFDDNLDAGGSPADVFVCSPAGGAGTGIIIPRATAAECTIDAFIVYDTGPITGGVGFLIAGEEQVIGGPAADDDFGQSVFWIESAVGAGTFAPAAFGPPLVSDFWNWQICTQEAIGACCTTIDFASDCVGDALTFSECEATTGFASWTAFAACPSDCQAIAYCDSAWSTGFDWIENVSLADVDNTTGADAGGFGDYTGMTATVKVGATNQLSVTVNNPGFNSNVVAWIDWNHDFTWDDADETYDLGGGGDTFTVTIDVTAPAGALLGTTTMRVIEADTLEAPPSSCSSGSFGETEDYTIDLVVGICGDGVVDSDEDCDPGADVADDCCAADCQFEAGARSFVCRPAVGECDLDEVCPGGTKDCPADVFNDGANCKVGAGGDPTDCSAQDTCDAAGFCQPNHTPDVACGAGETECSNQDTCDAAGGCTNVNHKADGIDCGRAAQACHVQDTCLGGSCEAADYFLCGEDDGCCPPVGGQSIDAPACSPRDHDPDCGDPVPTVSTWGLVILAMLLLVAMKVHFGRRRSVA